MPSRVFSASPAPAKQRPSLILRLLTVLVWALVAASAVFWGVGLTQPTTPWVAPALAQRAAQAIDTAAISRLLGAPPLLAPKAHEPAIDLVLTGVVAARSGQGAALISVQGRPPRPFQVGQAVSEGLVLQSVQGRRALLGARLHGPATLTLELPALRTAG